VIPRGLILVDTSVIARVQNTEVAQELARLGQLGLLATAVTIDLEVLYSARSPSEYLLIAARRKEGFTDLPLLPEIGFRSTEVQAGMAGLSQHRGAGVIDLLTASIAEHYGATVLHYDADFDLIAKFTRQSTRWIAPRGSLD
jgi:predicted nucleic acid-binding protein